MCLHSILSQHDPHKISFFKIHKALIYYFMWFIGLIRIHLMFGSRILQKLNNNFVNLLNLTNEILCFSIHYFQIGNGS